MSATETDANITTRRHAEDALEPDLVIVDPHHHLWPDGQVRVPPAPGDPDDAGTTVAVATAYSLDDLRQDVSGGHSVTETVYVECLSHYHDQGPHELRSVGETSWVAEQGNQESTGLLSGIVGYADMLLGAETGRVLDAHLLAAGSRFKGVRYTVSWDPHVDAYVSPRKPAAGVLLAPAFGRGVAELARRSLVFETWCYFHQLLELCEMARQHPELTIVLNHLGGPAANGPYAGRRREVLESWRRGIHEVSECPNIVLKLGAIGMPVFVEPSFLASAPHSSQTIADYWGPELRFCIETLGPERCMFESNFPVDSHLCDYVTLWNSFKLVTASYAPHWREKLFAGTARQTYKLEPQRFERAPI